jgi:hypothetical protein
LITPLPKAVERFQGRVWCVGVRAGDAEPMTVQNKTI